MLLENKYYQITDRKTDGQDTIFHIAVLPDCEVYRGHFPGDPVCPGVCNIETIKECAMLLTGKRLFISQIKQCRLTAVATPASCPQLELRMNALPTGQGFIVTASLSDINKTYMEFKGEMTLEMV